MCLLWIAVNRNDEKNFISCIYHEINMHENINAVREHTLVIYVYLPMYLKYDNCTHTIINDDT